jgi:crotonobetainyl-CoA:carnitine CoA-transferase CaiB-like acyl-CoA transferase
VVKIEVPPHGDPTRGYAPLKDGQSYFFHLNNSGKSSLVLDLKSEEGAEDLRRILASSDVLIENLKPGALAKLGFGATDVLRQFPKLVYCSISGYGTKSVYKGRPGMDSVVQGMAGLMDATRSHGNPYKGGISISDICGGQLAVLAIMGALDFRERAGNGQFVDVSMLDASAWLTHLAWNNGPDPDNDKLRIVRCTDGFVAVVANDESPEAARAICNQWRAPGGEGVRISRDELVKMLKVLEIESASVHSVVETITHAQSKMRGLIAQGVAPDGQTWPHVVSPVRIRGVTLPHLRAAGQLLDDQARLSTRFGLSTGAASRVAQCKHEVVSAMHLEMPKA